MKNIIHNESEEEAMNENMKAVQEKIAGMKKDMIGFRYRHFKGGIYVVTDIAVHTETLEPMVVYKSFDNPEYVWCRPLNMFRSEVDHKKYPDVTQLMRFERIEQIL